MARPDNFNVMNDTLPNRGRAEKGCFDEPAAIVDERAELSEKRLRLQAGKNGARDNSTRRNCP